MAGHLAPPPKTAASVSCVSRAIQVPCRPPGRSGSSPRRLQPRTTNTGLAKYPSSTKRFSTTLAFMALGRSLTPICSAWRRTAARGSSPSTGQSLSGASVNWIPGWRGRCRHHHLVVPVLCSHNWGIRDRVCALVCLFHFRPGTAWRSRRMTLPVVLAAAEAELQMLPVGGGEVLALEQLRGPRVQCTETVPAGLLCQGARQKAFADSRRPSQHHVLFAPHPRRLVGQAHPARSFQPPRVPEVDVLHAGRLLQLRQRLPPRQRPALLPRPLRFHQ